LRDLRLGQYAGDMKHHDADSIACGGSCSAAARNAPSGDDAS